MGRKKNKQRRNKLASNNAGNDQDFKTSCKNLDASTDHELEAVLLSTSSGIDKSVIKSDHARSKEAEVIFKKYHAKTERFLGREYFVHSLCQVCKEELSSRVLCPKCHMISYCSQEHRKQHWAEHADLCQAIAQVCADRQTDQIMQGSLNCSPEEFRVFRFQNMVECEAKMNRVLERWEREMFIFPNVCGKCHEYEYKHLVICEFCRHSGFCKDHGTPSHSKWCELLLRYKNIVRDQNKFGVACPSIPKSELLIIPPKLQNMQTVFRGILNYIDVFEFVELTEITTYPLTALNALLIKNENQQLNKMSLHIIGAEADFDINKPEKWEYYLLHLMPSLQTLEVVFIGPELRPTAEQKSVTVCSKCKEAKKSMTLRFQRGLYHVFSKYSRFRKPQLVCVFNPGLYRTTGFNNADTWGPTIASMLSQDCPVLTTAYTHREIIMDVQRVQQTLNIRLDLQPTLNPFSSLKPNLNVVSDEDSPVIFKNQYYCIMSKPL